MDNVTNPSYSDLINVMTQGEEDHTNSDTAFGDQYSNINYCYENGQRYFRIRDEMMRLFSKTSDISLAVSRFKSKLPEAECFHKTKSPKGWYAKDKYQRLCHEFLADEDQANLIRETNKAFAMQQTAKRIINKADNISDGQKVLEGYGYLSLNQATKLSSSNPSRLRTLMKNGQLVSERSIGMWQICPVSLNKHFPFDSKYMDYLLEMGKSTDKINDNRLNTLAVGVYRSLVEHTDNKQVKWNKRYRAKIKATAEEVPTLQARCAELEMRVADLATRFAELEKIGATNSLITGGLSAKNSKMEEEITTLQQKINQYREVVKSFRPKIEGIAKEHLIRIQRLEATTRELSEALQKSIQIQQVYRGFIGETSKGPYLQMTYALAVIVVLLMISIGVSTNIIHL